MIAHGESRGQFLQPLQLLPSMNQEGQAQKGQQLLVTTCDARARAMARAQGCKMQGAKGERLSEMRRD